LLADRGLRGLRSSPGCYRSGFQPGASLARCVLLHRKHLFDVASDHHVPTPRVPRAIVPSGGRPLLCRVSSRNHCAQTFGLGQFKLVGIEGYKAAGFDFQAGGHMPQVERAAGIFIARRPAMASARRRELVQSSGSCTKVPSSRSCSMWRRMSRQ